MWLSVSGSAPEISARLRCDAAGSAFEKIRDSGGSMAFRSLAVQRNDAGSTVLVEAQFAGDGLLVPAGALELLSGEELKFRDYADLQSDVREAFRLSLRQLAEGLEWTHDGSDVLGLPLPAAGASQAVLRIGANLAPLFGESSVADLAGCAPGIWISVSLEASIAIGAGRHTATVHGTLTLGLPGTASFVPTVTWRLPSLGLRLPPLRWPGLRWAALTWDAPDLPQFSGMPAWPSSAWRLRTVPPDDHGSCTAAAEADEAASKLTSLKIVAPSVEVLYDDAPVLKISRPTFGWSAADGWAVTCDPIDAFPIELPGGFHAVGGLRLVWSPVRLSFQSLTPGEPLTGTVSIRSISVESSRDAAVRLTVSAVLEFEGDSFSLKELQILEPTVADCSALVKSLLLGGYAPVGGFALSFSAAPAAVVQAVGRAAGVVASLIGEVIAFSGALAQQAGLVLADLTRKLTTALTGVHLEVYYDRATLRLQQVLVIFEPSGSLSSETAGLVLSVPEKWRLGLLLDFRAGLGAWLLAVPPDSPSEVVLSTDLWLARADSTSAIADTDSAGSPAQAPLVQLKLKPQAGPPAAIALLGVRNGEAQFLLRVGQVNTQWALAAPQPVPFIAGELSVAPLLPAKEELSIEVAKDRLLPFLKGAQGSDQLAQTLAQHVQIERFQYDGADWPTLRATISLLISAAGLKTKFDAQLQLSLPSLTARFRGDTTFRVKANGLDSPQSALGLDWHFEGNAAKDIFELQFDEGELQVGLAPGARLTLYYPAIGSDGRGLAFQVTYLLISRAGVDLDAKVLPDPVVLNGLGQAFRFDSGLLKIRAGRIGEALVSGTGRLPPALVGEAPVTIVLRFAEQSGALALVSARARLDLRDKPLVCEGTRFRFELSALDLAFVRDGGFHFYFELTGSAQFRPAPGEIPGSLLKYLPDVRIDLASVPLTGDTRVLARHISIQVPIRPAKRVTLFNAFTFELRGIGFHPQCPAFDGDPALILSGQIALADVGDVKKPAIDFHGLCIAGPDARSGSSLPRVRCGTLGLELDTGAVQIRGSLTAVDGSLPSLYRPPGLPEQFKVHGFLGEGSVTINRFVSLSAAMGFVEVEDPEKPGEFRRAFFLYLERDRISHPITTPVWPLFIREVGYGFGYRFTLLGIKLAEGARSIAELIALLDDVSKRQGDLSRIAAWILDVERDGSPRITLAMRAAVSMASAQVEGGPYRPKEESELANPLLFDFTAALRSDLTLLMVVRGWLSTNYDDFLNGGTELRENPTAVGYMYISVPRSEFLARFRNNTTGYIGNRPPMPEPFKAALRSVEYSSTLYIRPGLFHFELGWPNELRWRIEKGPLRIECSGGFVYRVADGAFLQAANLAARATLRIEGRAGGGSLGLAASAVVDFAAQARLVTVIDTRSLRGSMFYGLIAFDASISVAVSAWMRVDLRFTSFTLRVSFGFSVHVSAAVELVLSAENGIGARAQIQVAVRVFGATLGVALTMEENSGALADARARVQRYLSLGLTLASPQGPSDSGTPDGDAAVANSAAAAPAVDPARSLPKPALQAPAPPAAAPAAGAAAPAAAANQVPGLPPELQARPIKAHPFQWIVRVVERRPPELPLESDGWVYLMPVPRGDGFYAPPRSADAPDHTMLQLDAEAADALWIARPGNAGGDAAAFPRWRFERLAAAGVRPDPAMAWPTRVDWDGPINRAEQEALTFRQALTGCYDVAANGEFLEPAGRSETEVDRAAPAPVTGADPESRARARHDASRSSERWRRSGRRSQAYDVRDFVLAQLLSDLNGFAQSAADTDAGVLGTGLVFAMRRGDYERLGPRLSQARLRKRSGSSPPAAQPPFVDCGLSLFQPAEWFFDQPAGRPRLIPRQAQIAHDGVRLDWDIVLPWQSGTPNEDPEYWVAYYEIRRDIDGRESDSGARRIKPCASIEVREDGSRKLTRPDSSYADDLSSLTARERLALLGSPDPADAVAVCSAWLECFRRDSVGISYRVTPVDTAGTRGLPQTLKVLVRRPEMPLHAARGSLLFEFAELPSTAGGSRRDARAQLRSFIRVDDPRWSRVSPRPEITVERSYRLIVAYENTLPVGTYGADGLTARVIGAPVRSDEPGVSAANEVAFEFSFEDVSRLQTGPQRSTVRDRRAPLRIARPRGASRTLPEVDPDDDRHVPLALAFLLEGELPDQLLQADRETLLQALWSRGFSSEDPRSSVSRPACRFFLETVVTVSSKALTQPVVLRSERTPVEFEMRFGLGDDPEWLSQCPPETRPKDSVLRHAIRPDLFEWPILRRLETVPYGNMDVQTGFAFRLAPRVSTPSETEDRSWRRSGLKDFVHPGHARPLLSLRDPDRRIATVLRWLPAPGGTEKLDAALVAGYDVFELDLDDLPPSRTRMPFRQPSGPGLAAGPQEQDGIGSAAWTYARRVAHVQLLPIEQARLQPADTSDLPNWAAVYPSETWRTQRNSKAGSGGDPAAVRRPWFSAAEATPHWPSRVARRSLLARLEAVWVDELMAGGVPDALLIGAAADNLPADLSADAVPLFELCGDWFAGLLRPPAIAETSAAVGGIRWTRIELKPDQSRQADVVDRMRRVLMALMWTGALWKNLPGSPIAGDGSPRPGRLVLQAVAVSGDKAIATASVPVERYPSVHAVLDELVTRLEYGVYPDGPAVRTLSRRRVATNATTVAPAPADIASFFAATPPEQDPYGWGVLQRLGLAACLRLFDTAKGEFVASKELVRDVSRAAQAVHLLYGLDEPAAVGTVPVFADVLMRPMSTLGVSGFDTPVSSDEGAADPAFLERGLSAIQVSLRPTIEMTASFFALEVSVNDAEVPAPADAVLTFGLGPRAASDPLEPIYFAQPRSGAAATRVGASSAAVRIDLSRLPRNYSVQDGPPRYFAGVFRVGSPDAAPLPPEPVSHRVVVELLATQHDGTVRTISPELHWSWIDPVGAEIHDREKAVLGRFAPRPAEDVAAPDASQDPVLGGIRQLLRLFAGTDEPPAGAMPADARARERLVSQYRIWSARFLDHSDLPPKLFGNVSDATSIGFSIASPEGQSPVRHAIEDGAVVLRRLHKDRWAHHRLYAVQPVSRYAALARATGTPIGDRPAPGPWDWAEAVTRRTERVAAPTIVSSRRAELSVSAGPDGAPIRRPGTDWELVLLAHPEQQLKTANRALAARLEFDEVSVAFLREYRYGAWLTKLGKAQVLLPAEIDPLGRQRDGKWQALSDGSHAAWQKLVPDDAPDAPIGGLDGVSETLRRHPVLTAGAEVYRFSRLPYWYAVHAMAVARAGIVVSPVVHATQTDFHYALQPEGFREPARRPALLLPAVGSPAVLELKLPMPRHRDLADPATAALWTDPTGAIDLPDPETGCFVERVDRPGPTSGDGSRTVTEIELWPASDPKEQPLSKITWHGAAWQLVESQVTAGTGGGPVPDLRYVLQLKLNAKPAEVPPARLPAFGGWPEHARLDAAIRAQTGLPADKFGMWSLIAPWHEKAVIAISRPADDAGWQALAGEARQWLTLLDAWIVSLDQIDAVPPDQPLRQALEGGRQAFSDFENCDDADRRAPALARFGGSPNTSFEISPWLAGTAVPAPGAITVAPAAGATIDLSLPLPMGTALRAALRDAFEICRGSLAESADSVLDRTEAFVLGQDMSARRLAAGAMSGNGGGLGRTTLPMSPAATSEWLDRPSEPPTWLRCLRPLRVEVDPPQEPDDGRSVHRWRRTLSDAVGRVVSLDSPVGLPVAFALTALVDLTDDAVLARYRTAKGSPPLPTELVVPVDAWGWTIRSGEIAAVLTPAGVRTRLPAGADAAKGWTLELCELPDRDTASRFLEPPGGDRPALVEDARRLLRHLLLAGADALQLRMVRGSAAPLVVPVNLP